MQAIAIAVAISAVIGGAVGAAAVALTASAPLTCPEVRAGAPGHQSDDRPVPTTGSQGF